MAPRFVREIAKLAPSGFRRAVAGGIVDLKGLPARLKDPARRNEPWNFVHNVGNCDFQLIGAMLLANLRDHAGLQSTDRVLDIGCGNGRVAAPLAPILKDGGGYIGFDISRAGIAACRRLFAGQPHMVFAHLDVRNAEYNARGKIAELDTVFPAADETIDLAFATSVFTHMQMPAVRRYLAEAARVLKPGGRFAFTAFALETGRDASANFIFKPFDETSAAVDPRFPERAIGHRRQALEAALVEAGLEVKGFWRGYWHSPHDYDGGQDLYLAVKPDPRRGSRLPG